MCSWKLWLCKAKQSATSGTTLFAGTLRIMFIGSVDRVSSAKLKKHYDRKLKEDSRAKKALKLDLIDQCPGVVDLNNDDSSDAEIGLDEDLSQTEAESNTMITDTETPTSSKLSSSQMRRKLPKLAKICDRFAVSDRVGAAVGTTVLEDFGIVSQTEAANVIDRYKLRRERKMARDHLVDSTDAIQTLYFDGRKDKTIKLEKKGSCWYRNVVTEEHITILNKPGGKFITHLAPKSSSARDIANCIYTYYDNNGHNITNILGIGCDGTATNTGPAGELSTDQRYLHEMCLSGMTGCCSEELARRNPGKMAHSRWLTTANRILRVYISQQNPTHSLQMLATYIMQVYAPVWFAIKSKPSCVDGTKHIWLTVNLSRSLPTEVKNIIDPVIQRNAYFAHPENLLIAMVTDDRDHIKQLGLRRILKARQEQKTGIRKFCIPRLNFDSTDYVDLINWQEAEVTAPPLLANIPMSEITSRIHDQNNIMLPIIQVPCHTQAVERHVKLVTEASQSVCGERVRNGFIKNRILSRQQMTAFNQKTDYRFD
ncbi:hypothetical protein Bpfe_001259 [Biomphalaria pfeifferi]|uniref:Uncharacterized protein n=1 Tax=Biomphalaria pfeifferi TaxID=112525 RepID=A0AAD8FL70_BIOPF|nr:hypothetical protein Bpfe_001259 [Biomphalaria pfeifferi]